MNTFEKLAAAQWGYGKNEFKINEKLEYSMNTTHFNYIGWLIACESIRQKHNLSNTQSAFENAARETQFFTGSDFSKSEDEDIIYADCSVQQAYDGFMLAVRNLT